MTIVSRQNFFTFLPNYFTCFFLFFFFFSRPPFPSFIFGFKKSLYLFSFYSGNDSAIMLSWKKYIFFAQLAIFFDPSFPIVQNLRALFTFLYNVNYLFFLEFEVRSPEWSVKGFFYKKDAWETLRLEKLWSNVSLTDCSGGVTMPPLPPKKILLSSTWPFIQIGFFERQGRSRHVGYRR